MIDDEILRASALEQGRLVRSRQISALELTRLYLDRIAEHDGKLSAFVQVLERSAIRDAKAKDKASRAEAEAPFFGVPIGIKDLNFVRGAFTRFGSHALAYLWSPIDDRGTAALRRGGFVVLGKLATSELGALPVTEPPLHAPTRNPWNLGVTPGGSSGGSGAAVAAGLLPIAQGSDGAGSIRIPSSFCHLYGFKSSRGVIPDPYGFDNPRNLAVTGPIARSVDDAAAMLDVQAASGTRYAALSRRDPGRLRVRLLLSTPFATTDAAVAQRVRDVAKTLVDLGHEVEEGEAPHGTVEEFLPLWQHIISTVPMFSRKKLGPVPLWLSTAGKKLDVRAVHARHDELSRRFTAWFGDADLWLTPTVAVPPPAIGALNRPDPADTFAAAAALGAFTAVFNITGQPAASLPIGVGPTGLPMGAQLAGRAGADGTVLAVSRQLEAAMPWSARDALL